jgi:cephalosporin hydroxylase
MLRKNIKEKLSNIYRFIISTISYVPSGEYVHFNSRTVANGHHKITYRGIPMIRCPFDYVIYQMILNEIKPDLVIEIGTHSGGTALYLADIMNNIGHGTVHSIDIIKMTSNIVEQHPRIKLFTDGWEKYDLVQTTQFSKILVIEDGSHMYESSYGALEKFSPIVSIGSYYIVEDGIINKLGLSGKYNGGPIRAIKEYMKKNDNFIIDRKYCDLFGRNATFNVIGYLKKIK